jgi:prolipoprotein diacylglyceryltransferase
MILASVSYPPFPMVHVAGLHLSIHGVFIALGIVAGAWVASRRVQRAGGDVAAFQAVGVQGSLPVWCSSPRAPDRRPCP